MSSPPGASRGPVRAAGALAFQETSKPHVCQAGRLGRVDIPAGALPQDTVVTINLPADPVLGKRVVAEFLPHGVQFNTPVTLSFPLKGVALPLGGGIEVGRWENGGWTSLGGAVSPNGKRLSSTTPHFSIYAARGGAYTMAGG